MIKQETDAPRNERIVKRIIGLGEAISATIGANIVPVLAIVLANPNAVCENMGGNRNANAKYEMFKVYAIPTLANKIIAGIASESECTNMRGIEPKTDNAKPRIKERFKPNLRYNE